MLCAAATLCGCAFFPPLPFRQPKPDGELGAERWAVHRISEEAINESSGLVKSRTHENIFWTHNDSGDRARIFAIRASGELVAQFTVLGADNKDWEDIAIDDRGNLYLGDIGNNLNNRTDLVVYRIPEPDPSEGRLWAHADRKLPFRYAHQVNFPDLRRWNFDAEALFWMEGDLYLFTKHRSDRTTHLYRLPTTPVDGGALLSPIARLDLSGLERELGDADLDDNFDPFGNVTAADYDPGQRILALLTYRDLFLYARGAEGEPPFRLLKRIALNPRRTRMVESVAWDGEDLIVGSEQRHLFRIPAPLTAEIDRYPP
jgi:hypothetical protein